MAKQIDQHDFLTPDGTRVRVALLDNNAIRVSYRKRRTAVTWHAASRNETDDSMTVITPI